MSDEHGKELMELDHEAWPGFRVAFYFVFAIALIYLAIVLAATL